MIIRATRTNILRLRNLINYIREFGIRGTVSYFKQRWEQKSIYELRIKRFPKPIYCRATGSDFAVLRQVIGHQDAAIKLRETPRLIIDAGANVGYSSLVFSLHYPTATIVGVEPEKANCQMFRMNCGHLPNVHLLEGAVWPRAAALTVTNPEASSFEFQVAEIGRSTGDFVRGYGLSEIVSMFGGGRINLLKLDIEGAEYALFTQATEEWLNLVDFIAVELHERYIPGCRRAFQELLKGVKHTHEKRGEYECVWLDR